MNAIARLNARSSVLAMLAILPFTSSAFAAGFAIKETSPSLQGTAYAGAAAGGEDISALFNNPATIGFHEGINGAGGVAVIFPVGRFTNVEATSASGADLGLSAAQIGGVQFATGNTKFGVQQARGTGDARSDEIAVVPSTYGSYQINEKLAVGVGITAPFGLVTDYGDVWGGRYHATRSDLKTININPVISFKPTPKISIGAGIVVDYAKAKLQNAVDFDTIGNTLIPANQLSAIAIAAAPDSPTLAELARIQNIDGGTDGLATVKGDDFAFGFTAGVIVRPTDRFRFGIGYRSEIEHDLEGRFDIDYAGNPFNAAIGSAAGLVDQKASASATLPAQVNIGASFDVTDRLTISGEADWTDWSVFDSLVVKGSQGQTITETPQKFEDSWFFSVGGTYDVNDQIRLRLGVAFDQGAATDEHRTPRLPDADRMWVSAGLGYKVSDHMEFNLGYSYVDIDSVDVNLNVADDATGAARGNLSADGEASIHIINLGGTIKF